MKRATSDVWASVAQVTNAMSDKQMRKVCPAMLHGVGAAMTPLGPRGHCACLMQDKKVAEQLLTAINEEDRAGFRAHCKQYGVVLP